MRQNIMDKLNELFSGITDTVKVTCYAGGSQEVIKFEMLEHKITEENGIIKIIDGSDNRFFMPKTVSINPSTVDSVTYEDGNDGSRIYSRKLAVNLKDGNRIELATVAFG